MIEPNAKYAKEGIDFALSVVKQHCDALEAQCKGKPPALANILSKKWKVAMANYSQLKHHAAPIIDKVLAEK